MGFALYVAVRNNAPYTGATRWTLLTLADLAGDASGRVDFGRGYSVAKLARYAGVTERSFQRACVRLRRDGYLATERRYVKRKQSPNFYELRVPADWLPPDKTDRPASQKRTSKKVNKTHDERSTSAAASSALRDDPSAAPATVPSDRERDEARDASEARRIESEIEARWRARQRDAAGAALVGESLQRPTE